MSQSSVPYTYTHHIAENHSSKTIDVLILKETIGVFDGGQVAGDISLSTSLYKTRGGQSLAEMLKWVLFLTAKWLAN